MYVGLSGGILMEDLLWALLWGELLRLEIARGCFNYRT